MNRSEFQPPGLCRWPRLALLGAVWLAAMWWPVSGSALLADEVAVQPKAEKLTAENHTAEPCRTFRVREQDEIWVVSTRCLGCPAGGDVTPAWTIWKYDPLAPRWIDAAADELLNKRDGKVTAVFIHGNWVDSSQALSEGLDVYFQLAGRWDEERPVRMVIWSWPSAKTRGPLRDVRRKASRSDVESVYLAQFLSRLDPQAEVGLLGFSFGARIAAGAMHLLGGGELLGLTIPPADRPKLRVALWAAAEHDDWLVPGAYHGAALDLPAQWLITRNCCDPVLAHYDLLEKCGNPTAMGYSGVAGRNLLTAEQNARIEELDVTDVVGGVHAMYPYLYAPSITERTREYVLWHELAAQ